MEEKKKVALLSVFAAFFLTIFKLIVGILTGSLGIISETLHSGLDMVAAIITYFSVRISDLPADKNHNFGHGKIENFSAFIETILLLITCGWIIYEAIHRIISGKTEIEVNIWSYIVVVSAIIIDINRSRLLYRTAKKHNSQALEADALHFATDIWSSVVVLLGLICANFGFFLADSVAALIVALLVLTVTYRLGKRSVDVLLDKAPEDTYEKVNRLLKTFPEVKYFHDLKVRTSGPETFIEVKVHMSPDQDLLKSHQICDSIEESIKKNILRCEVTIHPEPQE